MYEQEKSEDESNNKELSLQGESAPTSDDAAIPVQPLPTRARVVMVKLPGEGTTMKAVVVLHKNEKWVAECLVSLV